MRKSSKKPKEINIEVLFELLDKEINEYDIRTNGAMEKRMTLVKFRKELEKYLNDVGIQAEKESK